jgi:6-pyruvoyltetrahydropterin/6-carboxytetrahydropterin synthase
MMRLTREVRFSLDPAGSEQPVTNSWAGWPSSTALSPWLALRCTLAGQVDPSSSYLCNIKLIDTAVRQRVIEPALQEPGSRTAETLTQFAYQQIRDQFPDNCHLEQVTLGVTPTLEYTLHCADESMLQLTQQFEFSASHRLHNPELSEDENRKLFGKCNNPHGHGHNYLVMVTVSGPPGDNGKLVPLHALESAVAHHVIDRMDHRNLNLEVEEFRKLNPSVENIAIVIWNLLCQPVRELGNGQARLHRVRVYETPKTWADYSGETAETAG